MAETPTSLLERLVGWCFLLLLGALALYGAVVVIQSIWIWIVVGLAVAGVVLVVGWVVVRGRRL